MNNNEHLVKIKAKLEELIVRYKSGTGGAPLAIAGWKSTLAAIGHLREIESQGFCCCDKAFQEIIAAFPTELLQASKDMHVAQAQELDTALDKLAKCREALELFDLGVGFGVTEQMYDKRKSALEETK